MVIQEDAILHSEDVSSLLIGQRNHVKCASLLEKENPQKQFYTWCSLRSKTVCVLVLFISRRA